MSRRLRRYLLADESPYSQEKLEEAMLADARVSEMLDVAEDELTDACLTGEFSETDKVGSKCCDRPSY